MLLALFLARVNRHARNVPCAHNNHKAVNTTGVHTHSATTHATPSEDGPSCIVLYCFLSIDAAAQPTNLQRPQPEVASEPQLVLTFHHHVVLSSVFDMREADNLSAEPEDDRSPHNVGASVIGTGLSSLDM